MDEEGTPFVFEEHIFPLDREDVKNHITPWEKFVWLFSTGEKGSLDGLDKLVDSEMARLGQEKFEGIRWFFEQMRAQKYCNATYHSYRDEDGREDHYVKIIGGGEEVFDANGVPSFLMSKDGIIKSTILPVKKGSDEFNLTIYDWPKAAEIPVYGQITVMYQFHTEFRLGSSSIGFTKNPRENSISNTEIFDVKYIPPTYRWYGKPGQLYYRAGDGLNKELIDGIFGHFASISERKNFHMDGKIYVNKDTLLYPGKIESDGTFPFFIRKDPDAGRQKPTVPSVPKELVV